MRLSPEQEELTKLKSKYSQLITKTESFQKLADSYWKSHYNQSLQSQVNSSEATRDNVVKQMLDDMVHLEDLFIAYYLPCVISLGVILQKACGMMNMKFLSLSVNFSLIWLSCGFVKRFIHQPMSCMQWTWLGDNYP